MGEVQGWTFVQKNGDLPLGRVLFVDSKLDCYVRLHKPQKKLSGKF